MNIFYVDHDPEKAARSLVDNHVIKMILESAQMLSTAHRVLDGTLITIIRPTGPLKKHWRLNDNREKELYKATHINHPSNKWVRSDSRAYEWLWIHMFTLCNEYYHRYGGKTHKSSNLLKILSNKPTNIPVTYPKPFEPPPCAMENKYIISNDVVENYRNYYREGKKHLHAWKRNKPDWITT